MVLFMGGGSFGWLPAGGDCSLVVVQVSDTFRSDFLHTLVGFQKHLGWASETLWFMLRKHLVRGVRHIWV